MLPREGAVRGVCETGRLRRGAEAVPGASGTGLAPGGGPEGSPALPRPGGREGRAARPGVAFVRVPSRPSRGE